MYEFHGWATIRETFEEEDAGNLELVFKNIQNFILELGWSAGLLKVYPANGTHHLAVGGFLNHKSFEAGEIIELFQFIADQAPGSYGLLYTRDDEDIEGYDNEFKVYVLARGTLRRQEDVWLSPFVPVVEDDIL